MASFCNTVSCNQEASITSLIDMLKVNASWDPDSNIMAGRLQHMLIERKATGTVKEYLEVFTPVLTDGVVDFLSTFEDQLDEIILAYKSSKIFDSVKARGILSAKRFFDTYCLRSNDEAVFESVPHFFMRIAAFCTVQSSFYKCLRRTISHLESKGRSNFSFSDMDLFLYFFVPLSKQLVCCSTPIMRSAGTKKGNLASCFIMSPDLLSEKSTTSAIFGELAPLLSVKSGVGCSVSSFSHGGKSIQSCLSLINSQVEYYNDQNARPVSVAAYMEVWHYQVQEFLAAKLPENPNRLGAIYQGLCIPKLFFDKFIEDPTQNWYLFDPSVGSRLYMYYGREFEERYNAMVSSRVYVSQVPIKSLMFQIINTIIKTGSPYIIFKEACNLHHWREPHYSSVISAANLCAEIIQESDDKVATCNLANICLPACLLSAADYNGYTEIERTSFMGAFVKSQMCNEIIFSLSTLKKAVEVAVFVINCAILGGDCVTESMLKGQGDRSMGIGVHGMADVFAEMGYGYLDPQAEELDVAIFENMYFSALETSMKICKVGGGFPFNGWETSKLSRGNMHWEKWSGVKLTIPREIWMELAEECARHRVFNSQFIALMPTVGSSQLTGYSEAYYPFFANMSSKVSSKEEIMRPNMTFLKKVSKEDLQTVRYYNGDVSLFPEDLKTKYHLFMSAFDYCAHKQLARARLRAPFVDQSQSHSFFLKEENISSASYLKDLLIAGYMYGLKTIMYYCKIKKQSNMSSFQCLQDKNVLKEFEEAGSVCAINNCEANTPGECLACQ
ncbi:ribonucleotide-reductase, large subunit [Bovine gammaherpesvirus 6]|uniref:Ribonucleoside-diphosphate reductase large subunit n=1 Tax=Bovine gammaherpesvirus 6 TaxID=1504288 RepID=A0A060CY59_9GAMA|nr:ribonucleotide-reductase, large subunit [Bovine gammaherpesvirus 6]AIB03216.1 ribonucleotide-reductase, large subunit [Bovine gammaherpesvirus 6]